MLSRLTNLATFKVGWICFYIHYTKLSMMIGNKVEIKFTKSRINSLLSSRRVYMSSLINFPLLTV